MQLHIMSGLLAVASLAAPDAQPTSPQPLAASSTPISPPAADQVDLHAIAQALGNGSLHKVPGDKCQGHSSGAILGVLGGLGGILIPGGGMVAAVALPAVAYLSDKLLTMLDCKEQQQAVKATDQAIRSGVGSEVSWKSESRPNVSGISKVTAKQDLADGSQCLTITDVVIIDGEETTVPKKMCRAKGASGYVRA